MTTGPGERHAPSFHRSASEIAVVRLSTDRGLSATSGSLLGWR